MKKIECADYDSMGNWGRFPITVKQKKQNKLKTLLNRICRKIK
jgi:hypothetical protein